MSDSFSIDASELETFGKQIGATPALVRQVSARLVAIVGNDTVQFARQQPSAPSGFKMQFKSARQRGFFFSALRSGAIQVPYRRTGQLSRSWLVHLKTGADTFEAEVTNTTPYLPLVQGFRNEQAAIHRGRWSSLEDINEAAARYSETRTREAESDLERLILIQLGK